MVVVHGSMAPWLPPLIVVRLFAIIVVFFVAGLGAGLDFGSVI